MAHATATMTETELLRVLILEDNVAHARFVRALLEGVDLNLEIHYAAGLSRRARGWIPSRSTW